MCDNELPKCPYCGSQAERYSDGRDEFVCSDNQKNYSMQDNDKHCMNDVVLSEKEWRSRPIEDKLNDRIEELEDALQKIVNWSDAYPIDIFIPPTKDEMRQADEILRKHGISFSAINCDTMRHVVEGVGKIAKEVLGKKERTPEQIAHDFDELFDQIPEPQTDEEIRVFLEEAGYDVDELKANGMKFINNLISKLKIKTDEEK